MQTAVRYDAALMREDLENKGWLPKHLADKAGVSKMTVTRFLRYERQTAPTAMKLAKAFGYKTARRYRLSLRRAVS